MTQNFINRQITITNKQILQKISKKVRTWLLWCNFNFKNERDCDMIKLPCLIRAKTGIDNRVYINCEKYISRMQLKIK